MNVMNRLWIGVISAIPAGEEAEVIVGVANHGLACILICFLALNEFSDVMKKTKLSKTCTGELPLKVHYISASLHLTYDHKYQIQNFSGLVS